MNWKLIVRGLCKKLGISHYQLSKLINIPRRTLSRYHEGYRIPSEKYRLKLKHFIKNENLDIDNLKQIGKTVKVQEITNIKLEKSTDLAEFIGIILGDGELHADGTIRISFDPKKDEKYLEYRLFPLIKILFNKTPSYESTKRIHFHSRDLILYFRDNFDLKPGNKVKTGSKIPAWCFEKQAYLAAVLRGLFDTDGYICYSFKRIEIMFGRFAEKAKPLVNSISRALSQLQIKHNKIKRDGRRFIRFYNIPNVLKFFKLCGSSNYRNIVRFLLWRLQKREARIEKEGINELFKHLKNSEISIDSIQVPFLWNVKNKKFIEKIKEDELILQGAELRSSYNWSQLMREILEKASQQELSQALKINTRSIRRWREGQRLPSYEFVPVLLELAESNDIRLEELKKNGTGNNRAVS